MKKSTWIRLHIYCGLFTSFYIIAFGLSSIILNHKLKVGNTDRVTHTWNATIQLDTAATDKALADTVQTQLGLMGWYVGWKSRRTPTQFDFTLTHSGKETDLQLNLPTGEVQLAEKHKGMLSVVHGLHFFNGSTPHSPFFLRTWKVYQWVGLLVLLLSLLMGLWLWFRYSSKTWELYAFGGLFIISTLIMLLL